MINSDFHKDKRRQLMENTIDQSVTVLFIGEAPQRTEDQNYFFSPNRNFYYLTGIEEQRSICMITKVDNTVEEYLFIPRRDSYLERYEGKMLDTEEAKDISGIDNIFSLDEFEKKISRFLVTNRVESMFLDLERSRNWNAPSKPSHIFAAQINEKFPSIDIKNIYYDICELRVFKSKEEIERLNKAVEITNLGVRKMMEQSVPGMMEYEMETYFDFTIKSHGLKTAFNTIAASGLNAVTLHYEKNNSKTKEGDLILFDLGAQYKYYCADISRTFPVNGKFTERQKVLYNIVLKASDETIKILKPGTPHEELSNVAKKIITQECKKIGLIKEDHEISKYYLHGSGHFIGLDTHDVGNTKGITLKPNMVLTIEPGLYIPEEEIGIRIEDQFVITEDGHDFVSKDIPRTIEEIEDFMRR